MVEKPIRLKLLELLHSLEERSGVSASAIVRRDGLMIASHLPEGVDGRRVAAMAAAMVGTAERAARELGQGVFYQVIVDGSEGRMISMGAGPFALLVAMVSRNANLPQVLKEMARVAREAAGILR